MLGLDKLTVGAKPSYGKYIVKNKNSFLSGEPNAIDNGSIEFSTNFSGNFAITSEYSFQRDEEIKLSSDGYEIKFVGYGDSFNVYVNGTKAKDSVSGDYAYLGSFAGSYLNGSNYHGKFKFTIINNELKTFDAKDRLAATIPLKENVTYTKLIVSGIRETDQLVSLSVLGDTATVTPTGGSTPVTCPTTPTSPTTPTGGAAVTLDANLNMKIPNATYQPALGNPINLWANFQFVPSSDGSMTWKLSNYGINP